MKLVLEIIKKGWSNKFIKNLMIFIMVFTPLILIDQLTKEFIFNGDKSGTPSEVVGDWKIIAFRSQFHKSTTFLDFIGKSLPIWASLLIDYVLVVAFVAMLMFAGSKFGAIAVSIALTGILGNTIDASVFSGVRNVFFIPWNDNGTFNFADLIIVIGAVLTGLSFIYQIFKDDFKKFNDKRKNKTNVEKPEQTTPEE